MDETAFLARFRPAAGAPRAAHPGTYPEPHPGPGTWPDFAAVLATVGGTMLDVQGGWRAAVQAAIQFDPGPVVATTRAQPWLAGLAGWQPAPGEAQACAPVGLAVLAAELAVAENACVLTTAESLPCRALAVLAQRLLILVPANRLVAGMTTAIAQAADWQRTHRHHHQTWISGPSKTADIEQCLVIGAHGARTLTVAVVDPL